MVKCNLLIIGVSFIIFNTLLLMLVFVMGFSKVACPSTNTKLNERIVGGRAVELDRFLYISGIIILGYASPVLQCGGAIVSANWVISASHCIVLLNESNVPLSKIYISSGNKEWQKGKFHKVLKMLQNQYYDHSTLTNDLALFKVKEPFNRGTEAPIKLAGPNYKYVVNSTATVIGWGFNESKIIQKSLFVVDVLIFSPEFCDQMWEEGAVTVDMFCAGTYTGGKDACQFDSGGPIVQHDILIGIVSWGGECGDKDRPGVYARISYFIPWLEEVEVTEHLRIGYHIQDDNV
ncbi:hypothetical protein ILUMI_00086 [Ignelater luminosus]|uniref:Peptidase S1 domain-containing protein n=1 Tax=Ignelater luminosus TaxID=2038154 RepID=A0A8K0GLL2_IGNLU|nr:hypothetical protein ILUMI_00086 [Ignelater luminosus]